MRFAIVIGVAACGGNSARSLPDAAAPEDAAPDAIGPHLSIVDADGNPVTALAFDGVCANNAAVQTVFAKNDGDAPTPPIAVSLAITPAHLFTIDSTTCTDVALAAGATCRIDVRFAPIEPGPTGGSLDVKAGTLGAYADLSTTAVHALAALLTDDSPFTVLAFGSVPIGATSTKTFLVKNICSATLTNVGFGSSGDEFSLDPTAPCVTTTALAAGETCVMGVVFTPTVAGLELSDIDANVGFESLVVDLSGTGTATP